MGALKQLVIEFWNSVNVYGRLRAAEARLEGLEKALVDVETALDARLDALEALQERRHEAMCAASGDYENRA